MVSSESIGITHVVLCHNMSYTDLSYHFKDHVFRYEMTIRSQDAASFRRLAETLNGIEQIEFSITPRGM